MNEINKMTQLIGRLSPREGDWAVDKMMVRFGLPLKALERLAAAEERGGRAGKNASRSNAAVPAPES